MLGTPGLCVIASINVVLKYRMHRFALCWQLKLGPLEVVQSAEKKKKKWGATTKNTWAAYSEVVILDVIVAHLP